MSIPPIIVISFSLLLSGCRDAKPAASAPAPAKVENPVKESDLASIRLTPEAETRVAIKVTAVANRQVTYTKTVAGEVIVPPGLSLDVAAPVAGTVAAAGTGPVGAGQRVRRGEALFRIIPLLPAERDLRINAERDAEAATATVDAARKKVARAEQLLADGSGSRRAVEEARAELGNAEAAMKAAQERMSVVNRSPINQANELIVSAPTDGVVETVSAAPGQAVAASAPLVRIAAIDRLWIKVPIYAGDRRAIDLQRGADVLRLDDAKDAPGLHARPVAAPPTANPNASSVDAVFELTGPGDLMPGERVLVRLSGRGGSNATVIPASALLHDIHGGVWVYEQTAPHLFTRRRVEVRDTTGGLAVLLRGPKPGALIVTTGAAELYGVEFGAGK